MRRREAGVQAGPDDGRASPRVLMTGGAGVVAGYLTRGLRDEAHVTASFRAPPDSSSLGLDVCDEEAVAEVLGRVQPQVILHPAALAAPDYCEAHPDEAYRVNVVGTRNVVRGARRCGARVVLFSTDYVFDGRSGPYDEHREPSPINYYGLTKALAEEAVFSLEGSSVLRLGLVYGVVGTSLGSSSEDVRLVDALLHGRPFEMDDTCARYPIYIGDILAAVRGLVRGPGRPVIHLSGPDRVTKFQFGRQVARAFGLDEGPLSPRSSPSIAPRPLDARLTNSRPLGIALTGLDAGIARTKRDWDTVGASRTPRRVGAIRPDTSGPGSGRDSLTVEMGRCDRERRGEHRHPP